MTARMKSVELFLGIKSEQTLRDAVREASEKSEDDHCAIELCPFGKKDWIAGSRVGGQLRFSEIESQFQSVMHDLLALKSFQRIRGENLRFYAVSASVPVFKDPEPEDAFAFADNKPSDRSSESLSCTVCGAVVHRYNIQCDPGGKPVGCYLCRGERQPKDRGPL